MRSAFIALLLAWLGVGFAPATAETSENFNLTCDPGDEGIWAPLSRSNHDNLVARSDRPQLAPGDSLSLRLQWEWRDWKPGSELGLRACTDLDGRQEVDGKATPPHQGPQFDFKTIHPAEPPERRAEEKNRRVVTHTVTLQVPGDASPGEFCTRVAVAGDPQAHRGSAPPFDIAETVCLPIAASAVSSDPGPPARTVSPPKVLPVTGGPYGRLVSLALGLLIVGLSLKSRASRNRKGAGDRSRGPGWKAPTRPR